MAAQRGPPDQRRTAVHAAPAGCDPSDGRGRPAGTPGASEPQGQSGDALRPFRRSGDGDRNARPRVLVIDDDGALCETIREALREEYAVAAAPHGAAALDLVKVHEPALIFLDLRMPIMDGWSFVQQYRRVAVAPAAIIVMSAAPDLPNIARQLGADGYLKKPFGLDGLYAVIGDQLHGRPSKGPRADPEPPDRPPSTPLS